MGLRWFKDRAMGYVRRELGKRMDAAGKRGVIVARAHARVDTGNMRSLLYYIYRQDTLTLTFYGDAKYTVFHEFGTRHMTAQPMLGPAVAEAGRTFGTTTTFAFPTYAPQRP